MIKIKNPNLYREVRREIRKMDNSWSITIWYEIAKRKLEVHFSPDSNNAEDRVISSDIEISELDRILKYDHIRFTIDARDIILGLILHDHFAEPWKFNVEGLQNKYGTPCYISTLIVKDRQGNQSSVNKICNWAYDIFHETEA